MNIWMVTNIRLDPRQAFPASSIQNLRTAMALASQGCRVALWVERIAPGGLETLPERLGSSVPAGLSFLAFASRGPRGWKRTPFHPAWRGALHGIAARLRAPRPDAVVSRSPLALSQLARLRFLAPGAARILEYQYPEYMLLWRGWRKKNPGAALAQCRARMREFRERERLGLRAAHGALWAGPGHPALLRRLGFSGPSGPLPSACLNPEEKPAASDRAEFDLGYVGALAPENGLETLLRAAARIPEAALLVLGGGKADYAARLRSLAAELGLAQRVRFEPPVEFAEVRRWMRRCRVGVAPLSRRQGPEKRQYASPLKWIEWLAAGVAVIAGAAPCIAAQARNGIDTLLARPDDDGALAEAARQALSDDALRQRLAENGLARAREYTYEARARRIAAFADALRAAQRDYRP
ncbi:MAG: D-inositol 3-phosphate glycosyltransferase [candidate division BRC1 bacterium ADurb.BinA364]|nr:MAG: D-inositol 3-phosphate glycosyltransferase [candidate division BRC1 bacterium ADurb.BinA364]